MVNPHTGTIQIAFGVTTRTLTENGHIMDLNIYSGADTTGPPRNVTMEKHGWVQDNMVFWYDSVTRCTVMLFQEFSVLSERRRASSQHEYLHERRRAKNNEYQLIYKKSTCDDGQTWDDRLRILSDFQYPHVQYQIIESLTKDKDGVSTRLLIPVHHLDLTDYLNDYQMAVHTSRDIIPNDGTWLVRNMSADSNPVEHIGGYVQASIVRPTPTAPFLVAFERDLFGRYIRRTTSDDDGYTWTNPRETPLPNSDLMSQAIMLRSGMLMLIYNPQQSFGTTVPENRAVNAHDLVVALSDDTGLTWKYSEVLEYAYDSMFLYPYGMQDPTCDNVYLTYSVQTDIGDQSCGAYMNFFEMRSTECDNYGSGDFPLCTASVKDQVTWKSEEQKNMAKICFDNSWTESFIKFQVFHESWVMDNHDWDLDYEGCTWEMPESLQKQTPRYTTVAGASDESSDDSYSTLIVILAAATAVILLFDFCWCCCRRSSSSGSDCVIINTPAKFRENPNTYNLKV